MSAVDFVSPVFMETSSGMLRVLEFVLRNDHGRLGLDLKSMFAVSKNLSLLSLSISLICFKGFFFKLNFHVNRSPLYLWSPNFLREKFFPRYNIQT